MLPGWEIRANPCTFPNELCPWSIPTLILWPPGSFKHQIKVKFSDFRVVVRLRTLRMHWYPKAVDGNIQKPENCPLLIYEVISQPSAAVCEKEPPKVSRMWTEACPPLQPDLLPAIFGSHERVRLLEADSTNCPFPASLPSFQLVGTGEQENRPVSPRAHSVTFKVYSKSEGVAEGKRGGPETKTGFGCIQLSGSIRHSWLP